MRRIVVDRTRRKRRLKRGGDRRRVDIDFGDMADPPPSTDVLALSDALEILARDDPVCARLVKLRYFAGLKHGEAAEALGLTTHAADRHWAFARAWLYDRLRPRD